MRCILLVDAKFKPAGDPFQTAQNDTHSNETHWFIQIMASPTDRAAMNSVDEFRLAFLYRGILIAGLAKNFRP